MRDNHNRAGDRRQPHNHLPREWSRVRAHYGLDRSIVAKLPEDEIGDVPPVSRKRGKAFAQSSTMRRILKGSHTSGFETFVPRNVVKV